MIPKLGNPISFIPTPQVRHLLEELAATGFWGRRPGTCVERIVERFLWENLPRLKPLRVKKQRTR